MPERKVEGILLDVDYENEGNESHPCVYIRTGRGIERFYEKNFRPYFYVIAESEKALAEVMKEAGEKTFPNQTRVLAVERAGKANAENALKLLFRNTAELSEAREHVEGMAGVREKREYDIPFVKRYLIDSCLEPMNAVEAVADSGGSLKKIKTARNGGTGMGGLLVGAFDIETYSRGHFPSPEKDPVVSIAYATAKAKRVFSYGSGWGEKRGLSVLKGEKEMISAFVECVKKEMPDVIVTYNGDMFDFPYLKERAKKLGIKFGIGWGGSEPVFIRKGMESAARLKGTQHLDAFQVVRMLARIGALNLVKMDLESVVEVIFRKKKEKLSPEGICDIWEERKGLERLAEYNSEDAEYTLKIALEHLPLFIEFSRLVRQTLFDASRAMSSTLVEALLIERAFDSNRLIPNKPAEEEIKSRMLQTYKGGYVKQPIPGLHENIAVLDFRSLHPSIMISHNVSPETLKCRHEECRNGRNVSPDRDWFCMKERGIIPEMLEEVLEKRMEVRKEMAQAEKGSLNYESLNARQHALKIVLNSTYGSLGYARFRWYSRECARAVTAWSRHYIRETIQDAEKAGFTALYGDSITAERFVIVQNPKGLIEVRNIEELFTKSTERMVCMRGKERGLLRGYKALSFSAKKAEAEWKPIKEIIRHKTRKRVFRVGQKYGESRVTEDHSIIVKEASGRIKEVAPGGLKDELLIRVKPPKAGTLKRIDLFGLMKDYSYKVRYRGGEKTAEVHTNNQFVWFGWMNQKNQIKIKRRMEVKSPEFSALCRLLGAYIAEGSSSTIETCRKKKGASIASSNIKWLQMLRKDYSTLFRGASTCVIPSMKKYRTLKYKTGGKEKVVRYWGKSHKLQMMNETSAVFFKMLCGQKSSGKRLPQFIFNVPDKYKKLMLKKILEGDGSRSVNKRLGYSEEYKKKFFRIETKSLAVASGLSLLLEQIGQNHTIRYREKKQTYIITTSSKYNKKLNTHICGERYSGFVYDLAVEGNNNFVDACGLILLHNTDSSFLIVPEGKTKNDVLDFVAKTNKKLPGVMELEFEGMFRRGIFVTKKEGTAAKKRYALIDFNDNIKIVGFEYVRRDWAGVAKETQRGVIEAILKEGDTQKALSLLRRKVEELRSGKTPKRDLVIMTQITKPLSQYASIGPHVSAAKRAISRGKTLGTGSMISYIVTKKSGSISEKAELEEFVKEGDYDADYYIENQVVPAVQRIFAELGYGREDLIAGGKQARLSSFG